MTISSSGKWVVITPNDSVDLPSGVTKGLYVGVTGDVYADNDTGGTNILFKGLAGGMIHPIRVKRVRVASTATNLLAIY
jgi:hypothetical protein